mgnify:CR=1 FL=1
MSGLLIGTRIAEAISLGDVHLQIVRRDVDGQRRIAARFGPTADDVVTAPEFELYELYELKDSVHAAISLIRYIEEQISTVALAATFAELRSKHRLREEPR